MANHNDTILKFSTNGMASVFASSGLNNPAGLAFDSNGNLYVANRGDNTIEEFNFTGQGSLFSSTNLLNQPIGLAFDAGGDLYAVSGGSGDILRLTSGGIASMFATGLLGAGDIAIQMENIPEPSALLLTALAAVPLIAFVRRKRT